MAHLVKHWTLDVGSGHDPTVRGFQPWVGLYTEGSSQLGIVSLPLAASPPLSLALACSLKLKKIFKINKYFVSCYCLLILSHLILTSSPKLDAKLYYYFNNNLKLREWCMLPKVTKLARNWAERTFSPKPLFLIIHSLLGLLWLLYSIFKGIFPLLNILNIDA